MSIRAFVIEEHGFEGVRPVQREARAPGPGEVALRMRALSLNYRDVEIALGSYHTAFQLPLVPLSDGVGEVVEVGAGVSRVKPGDRVMVAFWERWTDGRFDPAEAGKALGGPHDGVLTERFIAHEQRLVHVPSSLTDAEAASLPCAATTAWNGLMGAGRVAPGETVLVQGTGGVSLFALQFARMAGARVIATSSSNEKLERLKALGAEGTLNYRETPAWAAEVLRLTEGRGVDHVIEVGGPESFAQSLQALRPGGQINVVGYLGGTEGSTNPLDIFRRRATVRGIPIGSRAMLEDLVRAYAASSLRPVIDRVFEWTDIQGALRHLHSGRHFGKVVLSM